MSEQDNDLNLHDKQAFVDKLSYAYREELEKMAQKVEEIKIQNIQYRDRIVKFKRK